jgi:predicted nucleic acid-binding protein
VITADTNVFVYAVDPREPIKQNTAQRIIDALQGRSEQIALQLVSEFQNVATRKLKMPRLLAATISMNLLDGFSTFSASRTAVRLALAEMAAGRLSYWDALMLASAAEAGCTAMLSEDMQDGRTIFGVQIVNPFGAESVSPRAADLLQLA